MICKKNIRESAACITISVVVVLAANAVLPGGLPIVGGWDTEKRIIKGNSGNGIADYVFEIRDVEAAKLIYDSGRVLFVDARSAELFSSGHIRGAVSIPMAHLDDEIESFISRYPTTTPIVAYCSGRTCNESHKLAQLLSKYGYENISVLIDGFDEWEKNDFPVKGGKPA
jgi:rhodanese-related sulfurtransferase